MNTIHGDGLSFIVSARRVDGSYMLTRIFDAYWDHFYTWSTLYEEVMEGTKEEGLILYSKSYPDHMVETVQI